MKLLAAVALSLLCAGAIAVPIEEDVVDVELIHVEVIIPVKKQEQPGEFIICSVTFTAVGGGVLTTKYAEDLPKSPNYLLYLVDTAIWMGDAIFMTVSVAPACPHADAST